MQQPIIKYPSMISQTEESSMYGYKISTVGPGRVTGDFTYEPTDMDLAMKLHYLRVVYFFDHQAVEGMTVPKFKESIFTWLNYYYESCGRFRRWEETGRPYVKCNDCGMRFIEAKTSKTMEEWLGTKDGGAATRRFLVSNQVLGPDLLFSPMVLVQFTFFKCGGASVGLSWAHVLGDVYSLVEYMKAWGRVLSGIKPSNSPNLNKSQEKSDKFTSPRPSDRPLSLKKVDSVGDHWIKPSNAKMSALTFYFNPSQLSQLQKEVSGTDGSAKFPIFETLCAVFWRCIARVRCGLEPRTVTVVKNDDGAYGTKGNKDKELLTNTQSVSTVEADVPVSDASLSKLIELVRDRGADDRAKIAEAVGRDNGVSDFILYGANLTFVNWEDADCYGFDLKGHRPFLVNLFVDGVGEEGMITVTTGPDPGVPKLDDRNIKDCRGGRVVTVVLPESEMAQVENELKAEWSIDQ